jgi:hypothetical protein
MEHEGELRLLPAWRHALRELLAEGLPDGTVVTKERLVELFGLRKPITAHDQERFQLEFMRQFDELRAELLEEYRIALRTMFGESAYQVVPPSDQTELAMSDGMRDLKRSMRKMTRTLAFIRHEELTDEQRRKNADAQAKAAMLAGMIRNPLLPSK